MFSFFFFFLVELKFLSFKYIIQISSSLKEIIMIIKTHHKIIILLLSYRFYITFMLVLFHNKKCCNFINLFPCIFCELIVMGLVLSW